MKLDKAIIEQMEKDLAKVKTLDDMLGKDGLIKNLIKALSEQILEEELSAHLGYEKYDSKGRRSGNNRNGSSKKQLKGHFEIDIPRDRKGEFEPLLIQKYQKEFGELDSKIISMYAKGMSTRDIQSHLEDIYVLSVSPAFISRRYGKSKRMAIVSFG
jgi:transposase-like protein